MHKLLNRFWRSDDGAHAIEMAIVAPVLFFLIMSIIEYGMIMYSSSLLNTITSQAARFGKTGFDYSATWSEDLSVQGRAQFMRAYIADQGGALLNDENLLIQTRVLANIRQSGFNGSAGNNGFGGANQAVEYSITYNWPVLTPMMYFMADTNGNFPIQANVVVQNEDF